MQKSGKSYRATSEKKILTDERMKRRTDERTNAGEIIGPIR